MAKLRDLILRVSQITGVPEATVREVSRRLREGRLIQTGSEGRYGGADMMANDAVSLLTALLIVRCFRVPLTNIASLTESYLRGMTSHKYHGNQMVLDRWDRRLALPTLCRLKSGHTFENAFTALVTSFSNGDFERAMVKWGGVRFGVELADSFPGSLPIPDPGIVIHFRTRAFGQLSMTYFRHGAAKLIHWVPPKNWSEIPEPPGFDLTVSAELGEATLKSVGLLLRSSESSYD